MAGLANLSALIILAGFCIYALWYCLWSKAQLTGKHFVLSIALTIVTVCLWIWHFAHSFYKDSGPRKRGRPKKQTDSSCNSRQLLLCILLSLSLMSIALFAMLCRDIFDSMELVALFVTIIIVAVMMLVIQDVSMLTVFSLMWKLFVILFFFSIPWEFIRIYKNEVAKKISQVASGIPRGCIPEQMNLWVTLKLWLAESFTWSGDNTCLEYHKAMLADPLWEVTPLMVLTNMIVRCIVYPIETISHSIGASYGLFFQHIPLQWQPVLMFQMIIMLILIVLVLCRYQITIPFLVKLEPRNASTDRRKEALALKN